MQTHLNDASYTRLSSNASASSPSSYPFLFPLSSSPCLFLCSKTPPCPLQTQQQLQLGQRGTSGTTNPSWSSSGSAAAPSASLRLILIPIALLFQPQGRWSALATAATSGASSQWQQRCRFPHNGGISHLQLELLPTQSARWAAAALEVSCPALSPPPFPSLPLPAPPSIPPIPPIPPLPPTHSSFLPPSCFCRTRARVLLLFISYSSSSSPSSFPSSFPSSSSSSSPEPHRVILWNT